MYLDDVVKSPTDPNGKGLPAVEARLLAVFAIYEAGVKPIDTVPNGSSDFIAASPYSGDNNGTVFKPIDP